MEMYITLSKNQHFEVKSKVTNRIVTVTGFGIKDNQVVEYAIRNEGWWDATRFEQIETKDEKIERLERESAAISSCGSPLG